MNINKQGGTSWQEVEDFERSYRVSFPPDYEEFLVKYNGGDTPNTEFRIRGFDTDIRCFLGIGDVKYSVHNEDLPEWLEQGVFPIAKDSYGNYIVMEVGREPGRICFADHEEGLRLAPIMDSFKEFVKKCKSEKVDIAAATEPIADREAYLIARGRGHIIDDILREIWQAEIDKYSGMVLERVVLS